MTAAALEPGGGLSRSLREYEDRPGQRQMAAVVARALADGGVAAVEAGTGTGKTLAYLLPAVESGLSVVISTGTRALQDQLAHTDVPLLAEITSKPFEHAVVKGTSNYLCRRRLASQLVTLQVGDRTRELELIDDWARHSPTGDAADLEADISAQTWAAVSTSADGRLGSRCPHFERCFVTKARRRAEGAHLIIVNHHLFFADLALRQGGRDARVLPDYDAVIFDEAHLLEGALTEHFAPSISSAGLARMSRELTEMAPYLSAGAGEGQRLRTAIANLDSRWQELARHIAARLADSPGRRQLPDDLFTHEEVERAWYGVDDTLAELNRLLGDIADGEDHPAGPEAALFARRAQSAQRALAAVADASDHRFARFGDGQAGKLTLKAAPIDVSDLFRDGVVDGGSAVILTSATLTCSGRFDHLRTRLGLGDDRADEVRIESPFAYQEQAILYVAGDLPDPRHPDFSAASISRMAELIDITAGRTLVLFTSHRQLRRATESLPEWLEVPVLVQGQAPAVQLLQRFRADTDSVLLATGTFWQGIDVPGDSLSQVIIDKLPFAPPDDPLASARARLCEERGQEPFTDYQLPEAVMVFRQGAGRLIRNATDRGIISVLDRRLIERRYGRSFVDSLPAMPRTASIERVRRFWNRG
ncbi:MAG: ATP-dependent DNA helicase [Deltaproteobacteria bacterium]|nr:ATP-dependent DNA helicase [Deltaproteobacteria bacterium]